ncbi:hypothetical protein N7490_000062 [Penicillium lividum]|nr:hypothetical protein N7490_000062 [Penicillium lividum]
MDQAAGCREIVLCFDGTGYKFRGDETDGNVLKIYRMLDRDNKNHFHYYQPGIGMNTSFMFVAQDDHAHPIQRWYTKAKDAAFGSTFEEHVMAGYRYIMRMYSPGDRIYFFGFSRGAFVARLLAEMLDHIGLLETGNEGKVRFIWFVFSRWAKCTYSRDTNQKEKDDAYQYMKALRETFCRPVSQIQFLGLFDTVNSIPHFEMNRNKFVFPYSTKTSAKVIRHAVSIDEHRAKFRQETMADPNPICTPARTKSHDHEARHVRSNSRQDSFLDQGPRTKSQRRPMNEVPRQGVSQQDMFYRPAPRSHQQAINTSIQQMPPKSQTSMEYMTADSTISASNSEAVAEQVPISPENLFDTNCCGGWRDTTQDIEEVWFPGCHADIGGGLKLDEDEDWALSHVPLVWMVHEAQCAGLHFDSDKLKQFHCFDDSIDGVGQKYPGHRTTNQERTEHSGKTGERSEFEYALWRASTKGQIHDCLQYRHGATWPVVLSWKMVEYLPLRRMLLQKDQSWRPIRWPLPLGERRDIPGDATIHVSAIRRLEVNPTYRPKNLIRGGKGKEKIGAGYEAGDWKVYAHHGCPVRETYRRA